MGKPWRVTNDYMGERKAMNENAAECYTHQGDGFGRIASRDDLLCDLFNPGLHRLWKRRVALLGYLIHIVRRNLIYVIIQPVREQ